MILSTILPYIIGGMVGLYVLMCLIEMAVKRRMAGSGEAHGKKARDRVTMNYDYSHTQLRGSLEWDRRENAWDRRAFADSGRRSAVIRGGGAEYLPEASYYDDYDEGAYDEDAEDNDCHDSYNGSVALLAAENAGLRRRLEAMEGRAIAWPR